MITAPYFGLSQGGEVSLWCRTKGHDKQGRTRFWVINGHWFGDYKDGVMRVDYTGEEHKTVLCWQGSVPFDDDDYNAAIAFIREIKWSEKMFTEEVTFDDVLKNQQIAERNSNVLNLATAYKQVNKQIEDLTAEVAKLMTTSVKLRNAAENPNDSATINKLLSDMNTNYSYGGHYK